VAFARYRKQGRAPASNPVQVLDHHRVLAFDIRPARLSYCVLEGAKTALDWGTTVFDTRPHAIKVAMPVKAVHLVSEWLPHLVVLKASEDRRSMRHSHRVAIEVRAAGTAVSLLSDEAIRAAFPATKKYERVSEIASLLPMLAPAVPPKRKFYESESYRTSFFEAAAVALTYFMQLQSEKQTP
jgi:hypothetical protein